MTAATAVSFKHFIANAFYNVACNKLVRQEAASSNHFIAMNKAFVHLTLI